MRVILQAVSGPVSGRKIEVPAGSVLNIGRTTKADCPIPEDAYLSSLHFSVAFDGQMCRVRDLGSSNGTFLNGNKINETVAAEGDAVAAGGSVFNIHIEIETAAPPMSVPQLGQTMTARAVTIPSNLFPDARVAQPPPLPQQELWQAFARPQQVLLGALYQSGEPVYAVMDAGRESRIPAFLDAAGERYTPLYDPSNTRDVAMVAPYLILLPPNARLLDFLIKDGWSKAWGIYLNSSAPFETVQDHLRRYTTVLTADGNPFYFRFWDPRIFRVFLPGCTPRECTEFFGPVSRFVVESDRPEIACEFRDSMRGSRPDKIALA